MDTHAPTTPVMLNGVNVTTLSETVTAVQANPDIGKFQFRAANRWLGGGHNRSRIQGFAAGGQEDTQRSKPFVMDADEPPALLGEDQGANPVEFVLHGLAACMTTSMVYHAAAKGLAIEGVQSTLEGDLDLRGFLGLDPAVPKGYREVRVRMTVDTKAPAQALAELVCFSPVLSMVSGAVPVVAVIETPQGSATVRRGPHAAA